MKALLISANPLTDPYPVYPLGLDYLAYAVSARHTVRVADMNVSGGTEGLLREVHRFTPDLIGLSIRNVDNTDITSTQGFLENVSAFDRSL